jgi:hypothetical protein
MLAQIIHPERFAWSAIPEATVKLSNPSPWRLH